MVPDSVAHARLVQKKTPACAGKPHKRGEVLSFHDFRENVRAALISHADEAAMKLAAG